MAPTSPTSELGVRETPGALRDGLAGRSGATLVAHGARVVLGLVFLGAAAMKGVSAPAFREVVGDLIAAAWPGWLSGGSMPELVRYPGVMVAAALVISAECALGTWLVLGNTPRMALRVCALVLVLFSMVLVFILMIPDAPACGCLGGAGTSSDNASHDAIAGLIRNGAMIVLALWALRALRPQLGEAA